MIAYLSGAMENAKNEGQDWRRRMMNWLSKNLKHSAINPVEQTAQLVQKYNANNYRSWKTSEPAKFIEFVRKAIDNDLDSVINRSDYIICLWNDEVLSGGGTHGEVTMAYYFKKPVYLVNQLNTEISGWIMSCSTEIFPDLHTLQGRLLKLYGSNK